MGIIEERINKEIQEGVNGRNIDTNVISDTHHNFGELYEHRIILYLTMLKHMQMSHEQVYNIVWSDTHHDGVKWDGWLLVTCTNASNGEQISYHIEEKYKPLLNSFKFVTRSPLWDGHTSEDVLDRLVCWTFKERMCIEL